MNKDIIKISPQELPAIWHLIKDDVAALSPNTTEPVEEFYVALKNETAFVYLLTIDAKPHGWCVLIPSKRDGMFFWFMCDKTGGVNLGEVFSYEIDAFSKFMGFASVIVTTRESHNPEWFVLQQSGVEAAGQTEQPVRH